MAGSACGGKGPEILAVAWTMAGITAVLTAMRVYVRYRISPHGGWALFWTGLAFSTTTLELCFATVAAYFGMGNHLTDIVAVGQLENYLIWIWISYFMFVVNLGLGKVAAASFLLALHQDTYPKRRALLWFVAISSVVISIPAGALIWFHCSPPSALWNPSLQSQCHPEWVVHYTTFMCAYSALVDLVLVVLPIALIWPVQMEKKLKAIVCVLLSLGVLAAVGSIMDAVYFVEFLDEDFSYRTWFAITWAKLTTWLVLISTSVPPTYPLVKLWFEKARTNGAGTRRSEYRRAEDDFTPLHTDMAKGSYACQIQSTSAAEKSKRGTQVFEMEVRRGREEGSMEDGLEEGERMYLGRRTSVEITTSVRKA